MKSTLKIITGILVIIEAIIAVFGFFGTLSQGFFAAIISFAISIAVLAPLVAVWLLLSEVETLEIKVRYLENEHIRRDIIESEPISNTVPEAQRGRRAITSWTCAKCGTVNKANTANCENCGGAY
ncbi:MAG: zinc finger Ran-binding domain-containing family 2 protein [Clostridia bacterium]|nr:zinc finger Ran-binding domain-containing family 2 protein [Clostridia bacterium]